MYYSFPLTHANAHVCPMSHVGRGEGGGCAINCMQRRLRYGGGGGILGWVPLLCSKKIKRDSYVHRWAYWIWGGYYAMTPVRKSLTKAPLKHPKIEKRHEIFKFKSYHAWRGILCHKMKRTISTKKERREFCSMFHKIVLLLKKKHKLPVLTSQCDRSKAF